MRAGPRLNWIGWMVGVTLGACAADEGTTQQQAPVSPPPMFRGAGSAASAAGSSAAPPVITPTAPAPMVGGAAGATPTMPMRTMPVAPAAGAPAVGMPVAGMAPAAPPTAPPSSMGSKDLAACPQPPAGSSATAIEAWMLVNQLRLASGGSCMTLVPALSASAQKHCDYIAMNKGNSACGSGHDEVESCMGFTGATAQARELAAGYPRNLAYTEVLFNIGNMPARAIPGWINTPFHRIPLLDPWTTDMGWGGGPGCDIIDIGRGMTPAPDNAVVVYPYDGQTDVPVSFNGLESPAPPKPASGWPSAYPVSIYAKKLTVSEHVITKDGDPTPLEHMWLDAKAPEVSAGLRGYFTTTAMMYGAPYEPNTKYRVRVVGMGQGGPLNVEWTFTTGRAGR